MALGHSIGHCARLTQNNNTLYTVGDGGRQIHTALMGDPTLRMHVVKPPSDLIVQSQPPASVVLAWAPSPEAVAGYHVYRAPTLRGSFARVTAGPVADTTFTDPAPLPGTNVYSVRALKLWTSGSGSYWGLSAGVIDSTAAACVAGPRPADRALTCCPNPFVGSTLLRFSTGGTGPVRLCIFDVTGALVRTLAADDVPPGTHTRAWDGRDDRGVMRGAGLYFGRLEMGDRCASLPVIRLR
jgi:hypothetical protein